MHRRRVTLVGPTLLVGVGVILLLNNLGILSWGLWEILRLWPIVLIAAGLELLFGDRSIWGALAAAVLVVVAIAGSIWLAGDNGPRSSARDTIAIDYDRAGATAADINLSPAVANLSVGPLRDAPQLVQGSIQVLPRETLRREYVEGDTARLDLISEQLRFVGPTSFGSTPSWEIDLNTDVDLSLSTDIGVGSVDLDLREFDLSDAGIDFGVAQITMTLPRTGRAPVIVDGGIGTLLIEVPEGVGVRISSDSGLVTHNVPADYTQSDSVYTSPDYARAESRIEVSISLGIGTVTVRETTE